MEQSARTLAESTHYAWESPAHDIAILLNLRLVDRLQQLIRESPEREIGGLLLGNCGDPHSGTDRRVVLVEDFEVVPSQHVRGPAYTLKSHDIKGLLKSFSKSFARRGKVPVGIFRSHLRKGLYLDEADFSLFQAHFSGPCDVFLLARPEPSGIPVAGFFSWEDESLNRRHSYVTFPLDRASLASGVYTLVSAPESDRVAVKNQPPVASANRTSKRWMYGTAGAIMIFTALLLALLMQFPGAGAAEGSRDVALSVQRDGSALRLNWNTAAPTIASAKSGTLWISDAGQQRRLDLDANLLKHGSVFYSPQSGDVDFRLDVMNVAGQESESVRYVGDKMPEVASARTRPIIAQVPPAVTGPPAKKRIFEAGDEDRADRVIPRQEHSTGAPPEPQPTALAKLVTPAPVAEQPIAIPAPPPAIQQPPPLSEPVRTHTQRAEPTVSITIEPITPQRLRDRLRLDWMSKVPLASVLHLSRNKDGDRFVPPRVSHQVTPHVPFRLAREMTAETRLEFKVSINQRGHVDDIVLNSQTDPRLADVAAAAVSQWHFQPAQLKDKAIASDLVVIMHFHNPGGVVAQR